MEKDHFIGVSFSVGIPLDLLLSSEEDIDKQQAIKRVFNEQGYDGNDIDTVRESACQLANKLLLSREYNKPVVHDCSIEAVIE